MDYYVLELLPCNHVYYYKNETNRSKSNAGYDLYVCDVDNTETKGVKMLSLGVKPRMLHYTKSYEYSEEIEHIEESHFWLCPRSSIYKKGVMMANSVGIIDSSYRGELKAPVTCVGDCESTLNIGDRLFQIVAPGMGWIKEVRIVDKLNTTERGEGGFGSTGN